MKTKVIILAGGKGVRFGATKQFVRINGVPLFIYTLKSLEKFDKIVTVPRKYLKDALRMVKKYKVENVEIVQGGNTRQESVFKALNHIAKLNITDCRVVITDANRPFLTEKTIKKCLLELNHCDAVITACKSINTSCEIIENKLKSIYDRTNMYDLLMPQCFHYNKLYMAHLRTKQENATDDTQLLIELDKKVKIKPVYISFWEGLKMTYAEDYKIFEMILGRK